MKLKDYQKEALSCIQQFLETSRLAGAEQAFRLLQKKRDPEQKPFPYQPVQALNQIPYGCVRLPTGGGKTLLAVHAIPAAQQHYLTGNHALVLWLVPSEAIRQQTLKTLRDPNHINNQILQQQYGEYLNIFDISEFRQLRPRDIADSSCIILSTYAALRRDKTDVLKVYAHSEDLEPHFKTITPTENMERDEQNRLKYSLVNLLHHHRPVVIVDEAHNAKTPLSHTMMERLNPQMILEFTATPANSSNILYTASARALHHEEMIKLPINLLEKDDWQQAVSDSVDKQKTLELLARDEPDYVRPIVLIQAENKDQNATPEIIRNYLLIEENLPEEQIVIATGAERGLENVNLLARDCPVRFIITIQALREGWDCPFAYILCATANIKTATAVEQILGRVMRMPHARKRTQPELNEAYAFTTKNGFADAARKLCEGLVSLGFERSVAQRLVRTPAKPKPKDFIHTTEKTPDFALIPEDWHDSIRHDDRKKQVRVAGTLLRTLDQNQRNTLVDSLAQGKKPRTELAEKIDDFISTQNDSPKAQGRSLLLPKLCIDLHGEICALHHNLLLEMAEEDWDLQDEFDAIPDQDFHFDSRQNLYIIGIDDEAERISFDFARMQPEAELLPEDTSAETLLRWLMRHPEFRPMHSTEDSVRAFLERHIKTLLVREGVTLELLHRTRFAVKKQLGLALQRSINTIKEKHYNTALEALQLDSDHIFDARTLCHDRTLYSGKYTFPKHYDDQLSNMNLAEEICALAIDQHDNVDFWLRNPERTGFGLPLHDKNYYPDFIVQCHDGRLALLEYKGKHLEDSPDTTQKFIIGQEWAEHTGNIHKVITHNSHGRDIATQVHSALQPVAQAS